MKKHNLVLLAALLAAGLPAPAARAQFRVTTNNGAITIAKYTGPGGAVAVPARINGLPVDRIGKGAFRDLSNVTRVSLPRGVTRIGDRAFFACHNLASVALPNGLRHIGESAFMGSGLTRVVVPDSVVTLGDQAFHLCWDLTGAALGAGLTNLGFYVFAQCESLEQITIPNGVGSIHSWAFTGCSRLKSVLVGKGVAEIWSDAFKDCPRLARIYFQGDRPRLVLGSPFTGTSRPTVHRLPWRSGWAATYGGRRVVANDPCEPDNTRLKARPIANGGTQYHCLHPAGDTDWARFAVGGAGARNLRLDLAGAAGDTQMWLFRADGRLVDYDDNSGPGRLSRLAVAALAPGTYYVRIREYGNDDPVSFFTLRANWSPR